MLKALKEQNKIISRQLVRRRRGSEPTYNNDLEELQLLVSDIDKSAKITKGKGRRFKNWIVRIESSKDKEIYDTLKLADFKVELRDSKMVIAWLDR